MNLFEISRSALDVEWQRVTVVAQNLANAGTTRTAMGEVYRPMRLVSGPRIGQTSLPAHGAGFIQELDGVEVYGVEATTDAPRKVYEPGHPHADAQGYVSYPAMDHAAEMALMVKSSRIYEANVAMLTTARAMYMRALNIGAR
ncbi:flagellar basal-body rod protein FlgC (plasmid) [Burkholderia ubonensis]|uniref:Flagellar basal-body rod protein FlgC n=1 Tax=Burkholderia ubonensis TaxID=101571 RepID=A0A118HVH4_9BURK|nr:flagellar basal body rod protein FlgC [Burkholderia ubonensis]AOJ64576.1 flagellar basal-body rod protein FlgC [Burkholderia ubonensis]KVG71120.1 flagellar basal-body rod protein FlgC [Burkholderia ubonensis]